MDHKPARDLTLSPSRAFIQFRDETQIETGQIVGRAEHVVSGQAAHFQSLDGLLTSLAQVLREVREALPENDGEGLC